jgi:hypothetical protein
MCAVSLAEPADLDDHRLLAEWSSPGLNRCVRLTFAAYDASDSLRINGRVDLPIGLGCAVAA